MLMRKSFESLDFQSGVFFKELVQTFAELRKVKKADIPTDPTIETIEAIVKHHTGLQIVFVIADAGPCVNIPKVDKNHPFISSYLREFVDSSDVIKMMNQADGVIKGTVSIKTGKVTGVFSEIQSEVNFPLNMFGTEKFSDEELAAVLLHELGHLFTYYEYITRSVTTNQVLAGLSRGLAKAETKDERLVLLVSARKALKLKEDGLNELAESKNNQVIEAVILTNAAEETRAELGNNIYDTTSWEYLADEYATRHQAGRHLITALDKIYRQGGNIAFRSTSGYLAYEALKLTIIVGGIVMIGLAPYPVLAQLGFHVTMTGIAMIIMDGANPDYDNPEARMRRVRNQITENLKDRKLSKDEIARLQEDLKLIDVVMKEVDDKRQFLGVIWDWVIPSARKGRSFTEMQKQLEHIAANQLFEKAALFKVA